MTTDDGRGASDVPVSYLARSNTLAVLERELLLETRTVTTPCASCVCTQCRLPTANDPRCRLCGKTTIRNETNHPRRRPRAWSRRVRVAARVEGWGRGRRFDDGDVVRRRDDMHGLVVAAACISRGRRTDRSNTQYEREQADQSVDACEDHPGKTSRISPTPTMRAPSRNSKRRPRFSSPSSSPAQKESRASARAPG